MASSITKHRLPTITKLTMMRVILYILFLAIISSCTLKTTNNSGEELYSKYELLPPETVIIKEFDSNNIVLVGESHRSKQQTLFINKLIPILYKNGIRIIFTEFANYSHTQLSDSLITAPEYNKYGARGIIHAAGWDWAYQEYVDLYRAAWNLNKGLNPNQEPFRIIGLQSDINYSAIKSQQDWELPEKRRKFWNETDSTAWFAIIEKEALSINEKALVYCGRHHAFSKFHHPIVVEGKFLRFENVREGTQILRRHKGSVSTVLIHYLWRDKSNNFPASVIPFNGALDSIYNFLPGDDQSYGFQTSLSILGNLIDSTSLYSIGRDTVMMKDICDGYIVLNPACESTLVSLIPDFINKSNFENSKTQDYPYSFYDDWTIQAMNDTIKEWYKMEGKYLQLMKKNCN